MNLLSSNIYKIKDDQRLYSQMLYIFTDDLWVNFLTKIQLWSLSEPIYRQSRIAFFLPNYLMQTLVEWF